MMSRAVAYVSIAAALLLCERAEGQDATGLLRKMQQANVAMIEKAEPAVVSIARVRTDEPLRGRVSGVPGFSVPQVDGPADPDFVPDDFGAGVIIRTKNVAHPHLILTNYHVVRGGPVAGQESDDAVCELWVSVADRPRFKSSIVAADPHSDLAVITLESSPAARVTALRPKVFEPKKGMFVFALGNPYTIARDGSASASWGIVSNVLRRPYGAPPDFENQFRLFETVHHFGTLMQIGLALPLGTSGGAVLDLDGNLVGLTTSLAPLRGYEQSAGYAIPFTSGFIRVLDQLVQGYEVEYGFLGVRPVVARPADFEGLAPELRPPGGAMAVSVTANSPAADADLRPNDIIVAANGRPVHNNTDLMREVALIGPNRKARLKVWRPGGARFLMRSVKLGKWPVQNDEDLIVTAFEHPDWRGIRVDYSTARARYLRAGGTIHFENAVLVVSVDEARHGLRIQPGDFVSHVADRKVRTPEEFRAAVQGTVGSVLLKTVDNRTIEIEP